MSYKYITYIYIQRERERDRGGRCMFAVPHVSRVPNIFNTRSNFGHRFGYQSRLHESSGHKSAARLNGFVCFA